MDSTITSLKGETGRDARRRIRAGGHRLPTSGRAPGYVQGNLASLPKELAADFTRFCMLNPKPCPLLGQSEPGDWRLPTLGEDLDIRTDIPLYRIWKNGELVEEVTDLKSVWCDDLVSFVLGCSFSFEEALDISRAEREKLSRVRQARAAWTTRPEEKTQLHGNAEERLSSGVQQAGAGSLNLVVNGTGYRVTWETASE